MAWKKYIRRGVVEMRPYVPGESLEGISVSDVDDPNNDRGMIARNPDNPNDQWYVAWAYFEKNYLELEGRSPTVKRRYRCAEMVTDMGVWHFRGSGILDKMIKPRLIQAMVAKIVNDGAIPCLEVRDKRLQATQFILDVVIMTPAEYDAMLQEIDTLKKWHRNVPKVIDDNPPWPGPVIPEPEGE